MNSNSNPATRFASFREIDSTDLANIAGGVIFGGPSPGLIIGNPRPFYGFPQIPVTPNSVVTRGQNGVLLIDGQPQWYF